ncbi:hypothetical protein FRC12_016432 [Ceratobasidium sp. 428]|nr:hypothetical protein FRC12_016432 [Ceratobasidium sp. 428]
MCLPILSNGLAGMTHRQVPVGVPGSLVTRVVLILPTLSAWYTHHSLTFDASTLTSALRIATIYNYTGLRNFAIAGLEKAGLSAIQKIQISDEFLVPSWEKPAFSELCRRPDAITPSEAQVLGVERFVQVARIREAEQRRQLIDSLVESLKKHSLINKPTDAPNIPKFKDVGPAGKAIPASLPNCDCRIGEKDKKAFVVKCKQHELAPQILIECQSLLKEHNKLADGINDLGRAIFAKPGGNNVAGPLENELGNASWIRSLAKRIEYVCIGWILPQLHHYPQPLNVYPHFSYMTKEYRNLTSPMSMSSTDTEFIGSDIESVIDSRADKGRTVQRSDNSLTLGREHGVEDFFNTLKILYMSPIDGPLVFDSTILVSALRPATTYDYPALRTFAISSLENAQLSAIERIQIAREFGFTSWEEPAYVELCERDEPTTEQEANVLGMGVFVQGTKIREQEQRRRGHLDNARHTKDDERQSLAEECIPNPGESAIRPGGNRGIWRSMGGYRKGREL